MLFGRQFHAFAHASMHRGEVADVRFEDVGMVLVCSSASSSSSSWFLSVGEEVEEDLLAEFEGEGEEGEFWFEAGGGAGAVFEFGVAFVAGEVGVFGDGVVGVGVGVCEGVRADLVVSAVVCACVHVFMGISQWETCNG